MRLVKGAKETFGWVTVEQNQIITIPLAAWKRYGFFVGEQALFLRGSRTSGGFGISSQRLLPCALFAGAEQRALGYTEFLSEREVVLPECLHADPGCRLLTVFGSGLVLGLISKGPIYEEALRHPELEGGEGIFDEIGVA
jgi:hypothetical protein